MGPLRGDGNCKAAIYAFKLAIVEKMGPLRGDGNSLNFFIPLHRSVEKMGPLRGDGNGVIQIKIDMER